SGVNQFNIGTGQTTTTTQVQVLDDGILDSSESFTMAIGSGQGYTVGMPSTATVTILETPITIPSEGCGCGGTPDKIGMAAGINGNPISPFSAAGVDYFDGVVKFGASEFASGGFGVTWGEDLSWTDAVNYDTWMGSGAVVSQLPYLLGEGGMHVALISNGTTIRIFDVAGPGVAYADRYGVGDTWLASTDIGIIDTQGDVIHFTDLGNTLGVRGVFKSFVDPAGNVTQVVAGNGTTTPTEVQRSNTTNGTTVVDSYLYS